MLKKYAELIVKQGVALQKGQELVVDCSIHNYALAREITRVAYACGAKDVIVHYSDDVVTRLRYENCDVDHFKEVPLYLSSLRNEYAKRHAAFVMISDEDPEAMKGIDADKMMTYSIAVHKACEEFYDHLDLGVDRWCIVGAPSPAWAKKVFSELDEQEAMDALWKAIYHVTRCDQDNPIEAWNNHRHSFECRLDYLNHLKIQSLHYTNDLGTDLTIELNKDYLFAGGGSYTTDGIYSFPNMPTEEIFTSPFYKGVNGIVYSSMPLVYNGVVIDDFWLLFKDGRIVDYQAKVGYDVLKSIIETDEGSHYLGEVALVPYDSPIREMDILFFNTLFDENAACHLAIGKGFGECVMNGLKMNKEELKEHGINDSLIHVDFMIGTRDLNIVAYLEDGSQCEIFKDGCYTF